MGNRLAICGQLALICSHPSRGRAGNVAPWAIQPTSASFGAVIFMPTGKAVPGRLRETPAARSVVVLVMERARKRDRHVGSSADTADDIVVNGSMRRLPDSRGEIRVGAARDVRS
jgi:hypothetical protein